MENKFNDAWLYLPIIILLLNFIYRLIDQSQMIFYFPFDYYNDISSYMAQLHFLKVCGFLETCNYWYNGFTTFNVIAPGWFFFTLPLYYLIGDVKITTYVSMLLSFLIAFFIIYLAGKHFNFSRTRRIAFFVFLFTNALAIGRFVRLGRVHELFGWVCFLALGFLILYYKDKKFDKYSLLIIPSYFFTIISYHSIGIFASFLFLGLFLIKSKKEKLLVGLYCLAGLLLSSFWLIPFIQSAFNLSIALYYENKWLWMFNMANFWNNIIFFMIPLFYFILLYFYLKFNANRKKDFYFFLPISVICLLYFLRLTPFIPVFRNISPDPYLFLFLFFSLYFLFKIDYSKIKFIKYLPYLFVIAALLSIAFSIFSTPHFIVDKQLNANLDYIFSSFNGSFLIFREDMSTFYSKPVYSYAPIYYNLSTPSGWHQGLKENEYLEKLELVSPDNCTNFKSDLEYFNTSYVVGVGSVCKKFKECNLDFIIERNEFCLYSV
jgi:hypothetical protein